MSDIKTPTNRRPKTDLDIELSFGIDTKNRRLFFGSYPNSTDAEESTNFTSGSIELAVRVIKRMVSDYPQVPIEIHMNSYGGDAYSMLYLMDVILTTPCKFVFFGGGAIMSAATWIMAVCDERNLYKNARVMIHDGMFDANKTSTDNLITTDENEELQGILNNIYAQNSRMPAEFWASVVRRDLYLSAEETIMLGLADAIVPPVKRGNLRKKRQYHLNQPINEKEMVELVNNIYKRIKLPEVKSLTITIPKDMCDPSVVEKTKEDYIEVKETVVDDKKLTDGI